MIVDVALDLKAAGENAAQRALGSRQSAAEQPALPPAMTIRPEWMPSSPAWAAVQTRPA